MKRWLHRTLGLIVACGLATGCTKQLFISKECFDQSHELLPTRVEEDLSVADKPMYDRVGSPANLRDPDRPARNLTLREAFALALENGSVNDGGGAGNPNLSANDNLAQFATGAGFNARPTESKPSP